MERKFQITLLAVVILVLLRIAIGWHFLHEGLWKFGQKDFSAEPYLRQARGPFASWYRGLIPDAFGERRLDVGRMREFWREHLEQTQYHYGFTTEQRKEARKIYEHRVAELDSYLRQNKVVNGNTVKEDGQPVVVYKDAFRVYRASLAEWKDAKDDPKIREIPFQRKRHWDRSVKLLNAAAPWLNAVDAIDKLYRQDLMHLVTAEQLEYADPPPKQFTLLDRLETLTTYTLIILGGCLMFGFLTRLAALGGAVFLITAVILPQLSWPTTYPQPPPSSGHTFLVTKEVIEMLALLAICVTPAGRWAGLDYIGHGLLGRYYEIFGRFTRGKAGRIVELILQFLSRMLGRKSGDGQTSSEGSSDATQS